MRTDKIEEEKEKMEKLRTAVHEVRPIPGTHAQAQPGTTSTNDMINWVIRA